MGIAVKQVLAGGCMSRTMIGIALVAVFSLLLVADGGPAWSSDRYKCSFRLPDNQWKDTTAGRLGLLKDGLVEFMSFADYSVFSFLPFVFTADEQLKSRTPLKTIEATLTMIRAFADRVWLIREDPEYQVNELVGYKREIGYQIGMIDYVAIIVVLANDNIHYRLLFTSLEENYSTSFANSFRKIIGSFHVKG